MATNRFVDWVTKEGLKHAIDGLKLLINKKSNIEDVIEKPNYQVGNEKKGVYIKPDGSILPMDHTVEANVPANAKFTDTTYQLFNESRSGLVPLSTGSSKYLRGDGIWVDIDYIPNTEKASANGVATLDGAGKVPASQLPAFVDDVEEYETLEDFPTEGESGKVYIDISSNKTYRWGGTTYVVIGSDLALGETSTTAYAGDKGKDIADYISSIKKAAGNSRHPICFNSRGIPEPIMFNYSICKTSRSNYTKSISLQGLSVLNPGLVVYTKFTDTGEEDPEDTNQIRLFVGYTSYKYVVTPGTYRYLTGADGKLFCNNQVHMFLYDGTNWIMLDYTENSGGGGGSSDLQITNKTTAEYDALSETAKMSETIWNITDADDLDLSSYVKRSDLIGLSVDMENKITNFNADGSITVSSASYTKDTNFNQDGSITTKMTYSDGTVVEKKTIFNADGSISDVRLN